MIVLLLKILPKFPKIYFICAHHQKMSCCIIIDSVWFVLALAQFQPKNTVRQSNPRSLMLNIKGAADHSRLENIAVDENRKYLNRITLLNVVFNTVQKMKPIA